MYITAAGIVFGITFKVIDVLCSGLQNTPLPHVLIHYLIIRHRFVKGANIYQTDMVFHYFPLLHVHTLYMYMLYRFTMVALWHQYYDVGFTHHISLPGAYSIHMSIHG